MKLKLVLLVLLIGGILPLSCEKEITKPKEPTTECSVGNIVRPDIEPGNSPKIVIDYISNGSDSYNLNGCVTGRVFNVNPSECKVVLYAQTNTFYIQPFEDSKHVILDDKTWYAQTRYGDAFCALLVKNDYDPRDFPSCIQTPDGINILARTYMICRPPGWPGSYKEADIVPGYKVGKITLLDDISVMKQNYGEPEFVSTNWYTIHFMYNEGQMTGITGMAKNYNCDTLKLYDDYTVILLSIQAPYQGKTSGGNGIGSSYYSITSEFGTPEDILYVGTPGDFQYIYYSKGITFIITDYKVQYIYLTVPII